MIENEVAEPSAGEQEVAVSDAPTSYIGEDGNFTDGWMQASGISEDMQSNLTLKSTKNVASMASQLINAQKMIGKQPNMMVMPTEQSTQVEWDDFHKSCGRPDTPDEYTITHHEDMGDGNPEMETAFKNLAHSEGLRPETVQKLMELDDSRIMGMRQAMQEAEIQATEKCEADLKSKWGNAYEERLHLANRMIEENTNDETKDMLLSKVGSDPAVADFLANMAAKFVEHKVISADVTKHTPSDALAEADMLRNTPGYLNGQLKQTSPSKYKQITRDIAALYAEAHPE
jgi:uncharacterized protein